MIALALFGSSAFAGTCAGLPTSGHVPAGTYTFSPLCIHTLTGTLIFDNGATIDGGGGRIEGDGTFPLIQIVGGAFTIQNVTLYKGGGIAGSAVSMDSEQDFVMDRVAVYDNDTTASGGAVRFYANTAVITNSWFENNDSADWGGGLDAIYVALTFTMYDCVFIGNTSGGNRGQYGSHGYSIGSADINGNYWNDGSAPSIVTNGFNPPPTPSDIWLAYNAIPTVPVTSWLSAMPTNVMHPYLAAPPADADGDGIPDASDKCFGVNSTGDTDLDKVCNDLDLCKGDDSTGDTDGDKICDDRDLCVGTDLTGDTDHDGVCKDLDVCLGDDALGDADADAVCDDRDVCLGDDATRDLDADGVCGDLDQCAGNDALGDADADGSCDDRDLCAGDDATGDMDADGVCGDLDPCLGDDSAFGDADGDKICDDRDQCLGDDTSGNWDADALCDDQDPLADIVADGPYAAPADAPLVVVADEGVLANDTVVGGSIAVTVEPTHGKVDLADNGGFTYTPDDASYFGPDWFEYTWSDDDDAISTTVTLSVGQESPTPVGASDDEYAVRIGEVLTVDVSEGVLANDVGEGLTVAVDRQPATGALELQADGSFVYTPDAELPGVESFTYTATDGTASVTGHVTIVIEEAVEDTSVEDPWAGARCRCAPGTGGGGFAASALALAAVLFGRRRGNS